MFSDLECDFINPIDLCQKLNYWVVPEYCVHWTLTGVFLLTGSWLALLLNLPLAAYNAYQLVNGRHHFDATEIFRTLQQHKKEAFIKLGFYMVSFFYYLYRMILGLLQSS